MRKQRWRDVAALARQRGIRAQSVASAVLVVLVALLAGGVGLVYLLQLNLESTARDAAQTRANEVASMVQAQGASTAFTAFTSRREASSAAVERPSISDEVHRKWMLWP